MGFGGVTLDLTKDQSRDKELAPILGKVRADDGQGAECCPEEDGASPAKVEVEWIRDQTAAATSQRSSSPLGRK